MDNIKIMKILTIACAIMNLVNTYIVFTDGCCDYQDLIYPLFTGCAIYGYFTILKKRK